MSAPLFSTQLYKKEKHIMKKLAILFFLGIALFFTNASIAQISVTATAGTLGPTAYTTLRNAVLAINAGTHQGVINISVTANTTETALSTLNQSGSGSSSYTSITIKPAAATNPIITGSIATGILYIKGSNVTIDGSNTAGGTTQNLTIRNTNAASSYVIRMGSPSTVLGASNNTIKNCILTNASSSGTGNVFISGGATLYAQSDAPCSNNTIQNNTISGAQEGILIYGSVVPETNWLITGNNISGCGFDGILFWNESNFTISNNTISGVSINGASAVTGMNFSWVYSNGNVFNNNVNTISNTVANGCYGMYFDLDPTSTNLNVYNNFISNIISTASTTVSLNGFGIYMDYGAGLKLYDNSINMVTNQTGTVASGITAALCFDQVLAGGITAGAATVKNNALINNQTAGNRYGIYSTAANTVFSSIDYNDYTGGTALGFLTSARATIAQIQAGFGGNVNSITSAPSFVSSTDLHLQYVVANVPLNAGTPIASPAITADIDGNIRNTTRPTMGADELISDSITYTTLPNTCLTTDATLSGVSIVSLTGVYTSGALMPQIYFRKNLGAWFHSSGTLTSGTANNGLWSFTIASATMGGVASGDVISYYVVAQTTATTPAILFAKPSTGLVATDVNTVTTAPTTPNSYNVAATTLTGLTTTASVCANPTSATSPSFAFTGTTGSPDQYTLTWAPAGPTNVSVFTAFPASPLPVNVPAGTPANTYTGALTVKNSITGCTGSYTLTLTINPQPSAIAGSLAVCQGFNTTLSSSPGTGVWSSSLPGTAGIGATTGIANGVAPGTTNIVYTLTSTTGCSISAVLTVNPLPANITGNTNVCEGGDTTILSDVTTPGTWSTLSGLVTIGASSGIVTGVTAGSAVVTYTSTTTNCYTTTNITISPALGPITGASSVCTGNTATLAPPLAGGSWTCNPTAIATIDAFGTVYGVSAGSAVVTYTMPSGCTVNRTITVNAGPVAIVGTPVVCNGYSTSLTDATGPGTWSSANTGIASIGATSGIMTGTGPGNTLIVYTVTSTGCTTSILATVNVTPAPINGPTFTVCGGGATISLGSAPGGGTWSSGATGIATATGTASGIITGVSAGTAPITYTITSTNCYITADVSVIPTPAAITGNAAVCANGSTTALADITTPGTWSISAGGNATISPSGVVTGNTAGNETVTYTGSNTCFVTRIVTVNPLPAPISGTSTLCQGSTTTLSSSPVGSWTTNNPFVATVGSSAGNVYGVGVGSTIITYTLPTTCFITTPVTVNATPGPITGNPNVCLGYTTTLSNSASGGIWSCTPTSVATIDASGVVYGVTLGSAVVQYSTGTGGCFASLPITVTGLVPAGITLVSNPGTTVCAGTPVTYSANLTNGGASPLYVWSVNNMILSGASTYTYTPSNGDLVRCWFISSYGCAVPDTASDWVHMVVNPNVSTGLGITTGIGDTICQGNSVTLTAVPLNGGPAPVYQWFINTTLVGSGPVYAYTPANGDLIVCDMISNVPCPVGSTSASSSKILTVSPFVAPVVNLFSSLGPTVCEGYPVIYTATQLNGGWSPAYQWTVNGSPTVTGPSYTYTPANTDLVAVTLTSSFPCAVPTTATTNMLMTVVPIVAAVGTIDVSPGYIVMSGTPVTFTANISSGGGLAPTFQWLRNAIPIPGATNTTYTTSTLNDGDSISLQVVNTDLCSGITTFTAVKMNIGTNVGVQNVGTSASIALLPNPNTGSFTIKGSLGTAATQEVVVEITDMIGQVVYSNKLKVVNGLLDERITLTGTLANGMYLLNVRSQNATKVFHFVLEQ